MTDPFDPDELRYDPRPDRLRSGARWDAALIHFRRIWEAIPAAGRDQFKQALFALEFAAHAVAKLTCTRLYARGLSTDRQIIADHVADASGLPLDRELAALKADLSIRPAEFLCAIACWEAGEEYVPEGPAHVRWPFAEERRRWLEIRDRLE